MVHNLNYSLSREEMKMARTLGAELHEVRQLRGLSLKAVADPAGVSATYLQKLERDQVKSPSPHRLRRLAEVLGLDYTGLFALAGYSELAESDASRPSPRQTTPSGALSKAKGSLLRQTFQSEEHVSDEELEQLARYLQFLRQQAEADAAP